MADNHNNIEISDSEDDDSTVSDTEHTEMADNTSESDGRLSPFIRRSIRRSLHNFVHDSPDELSSNEDIQWSGVPDSDDDESDDPIPTTSGSKNRVRTIDSSDDEITSVPSNEVSEASTLDDSDQAIAVVQAAKEEVKNSAADAVIAQKKAYLEIQRERVERQLAKSKMIYNSGNVRALPDGGERVRQTIIQNEQQLQSIMQELHDLHYVVVSDTKKTLFKEGSLEIDPQFLQPTTDKVERDLGVKAQKTFDHQQELTVERLKDLHGSLLNKPPEEHRAEDPKGLKVKLMAHQQYALTWLLWREKQNPAGGVLADDMGLGKTLTMIALIMACMKDSAEQKLEEEWISTARQQRYLGGTLVVAPASLVAQWESEVKNRCKSGVLVVELYHGNNREKNPKRLARNDIVLTTYNILTRANKENGLLYKIHWKRVILDEAHVIRNHKSQTCEAVCSLYAYKRWVLTGTPVQNKEMDLFAIIKFLKCSPFDDLRVWKRWVDNKNAAGQERLATLMKGIMLRRTKQELQSSGAIDSLTQKLIEEIQVALDPEERLVYDKVMVYSRTLFAQFLAQRAEKEHMFELGAGKYDKPSWQSTNSKSQFTKAQDKLLALHADVQSFEILVLLLRLRQICCHPALIHTMLDREDIEANDLETVKDTDNLVDKMNNMSMVDAAEGEGEVGVDERVSQHLLTSDNPVFDKNRRSSKMRMIIQKIEDIMEKGDKAIVVSQWVSVLEIIGQELDSIKGVKYSMFHGKVMVKDRQGIMDDFNSPHSRTNVLLLSLTAGGVGLNLVGANHLLLVDIHWNPQLECQAQDRIYRFGQKKDVFIYKYICSDTIEERIKALQDKKLEIATNLLSGKGGGSKLTLDEMKSLFSL